MTTAKIIVKINSISRHHNYTLLSGFKLQKICVQNPKQKICTTIHLTQ